MSRTRAAVGGSGESDATEAVAAAAAAAPAVVKRREVQDLRLRLTRERRSPVRELGHRTRSRRRRRVWVEAGTCLVKGEEEEERKEGKWREIQDSRGGATKRKAGLDGMEEDSRKVRKALETSMESGRWGRRNRRGFRC